MWTFNALDDFCRFTNTLYAHHLNILRLKSQSGGMVVDMNLFWLWWVAHRRNSSDIWGNGNPFYSRNPQAFTQAIGFANSLHLPIVNGRSIRICNGMDVVDRAGKHHNMRYYYDLCYHHLSSELLPLHFLFILQLRILSVLGGWDVFSMNKVQFILSN